VKARYCGMCDKWLPKKHRECPACGAETSKIVEFCAACDREGATAGGDTSGNHTCKKESVKP